MNTSITFSMIKPGAESRNLTGTILEKISAAGFKIRALKKCALTKEQACDFYAIHKERPFFESLTDFMSSGPVVAMILEKENAVEAYRKFIGATNPSEAAPGTIRNLYAESLQRNAVHGADSPENALRESKFFFSAQEIFGCSLH